MRLRNIAIVAASMPNSMITGTGPFASAGVLSVRSIFTLIAGYAELSTWPISFLVITGTSPFFSSVVLTTSHFTAGVCCGTRPYTSRSKSSTSCGRRWSHHIFADVTFWPSFITSGSGGGGIRRHFGFVKIGRARRRGVAVRARPQRGGDVQRVHLALVRFLRGEMHGRCRGLLRLCLCLWG